MRVDKQRFGDKEHLSIALIENLQLEYDDVVVMNGYVSLWHQEEFDGSNTIELLVALLEMSFTAVVHDLYLKISSWRIDRLK